MADRIAEIRALVARGYWMISADDAQYLLNALDEARAEADGHAADYQSLGKERLGEVTKLNERIAALEQQLAGVTLERDRLDGLIRNVLA